MTTIEKELATLLGELEKRNLKIFELENEVRLKAAVLNDLSGRIAELKRKNEELSATLARIQNILPMDPITILPKPVLTCLATSALKSLQAPSREDVAVERQALMLKQALEPGQELKELQKKLQERHAA